MEAIGISLAILPLIVSVIDHYSGFSRPLKKYGSLSGQLHRDLLKISNQRLIFKTECSSILEAIVDRERASSMLDDTEDPAWRESGNDKRLIEHLGDAAENIISTIGFIDGVLQELSKVSMIAEEALVGSQNEPGTIAQIPNLKHKISYACSRNQVRTALSDLQSHIDDLRNIYAQVSQRFHQDLASTRMSQHRKRRIPDELRTVRLIKEASHTVYEAVKHGCSKHTEHTTVLNLEAVVAPKAAKKQHVVFKVGYGRYMFFEIASVIDEYDAIQQTADFVQAGPVQTLKRRAASPSENRATKIKKTVRFVGMRIESPDRSCCPNKGAILLANNEGLHVPVICSGDLCGFLRTHLRPAPPSSHRLLGMLGRANCLIYSLRTSSITASTTQTPVWTLQSLLNTTYQKRLLGCLSPFSQVRLARLLATALIQYYQTPWLIDGWKSRDIYLYGVTKASLVQDATTEHMTPHISVKFRDEHPPCSPSVSTSCGPYATNPYLYSLGILFIEIAMNAPLYRLVRSCDKDTDMQKMQWNTAWRMASLTSRCLGPRYSKIVQKCLRCDFGCGHYDLGKPDLETAYWVDVVRELEGIEKTLEQLQLVD